MSIDVRGTLRVDPGRIRSAWAGRISGCLLGKPLEVLSFQQGLRGGQVPVVYRLRSAGRPTSSITRQDGSTQALPQLSLPAALSSQLFRRSGRIRQVSLDFPQHALLGT